MNRVYRLVFNLDHNGPQVASEHAKGRGKGCGRSGGILQGTHCLLTPAGGAKRRLSPVLAAITMMLLMASPIPAFAMYYHYCPEI